MRKVLSSLKKVFTMIWTKNLKHFVSALLFSPVYHKKCLSRSHCCFSVYDWNFRLLYSQHHVSCGVIAQQVFVGSCCHTLWVFSARCRNRFSDSLLIGWPEKMSPQEKKTTLKKFCRVFPARQCFYVDHNHFRAERNGTESLTGRLLWNY